MTKCEVRICKNHTSFKHMKCVTFHRFPQNPIIREKWKKIIGKDKGIEGYQPAEDSVICSTHFLESDMYFTKGFRLLKKNAVPQLKFDLDVEAAQVEVCQVCLATDVKLYNLQHGKWKNLMDLVTRFHDDKIDGLPQYVCYECGAHILKYHRLIEKSKIAQTTLLDIYNEDGQITKDLVKRRDRVSLNLQSPFSCSDLIEISILDIFGKEDNSLCNESSSPVKIEISDIHNRMYVQNEEPISSHENDNVAIKDEQTDNVAIKDEQTDNVAIKDEQTVVGLLRADDDDDKTVVGLLSDEFINKEDNLSSNPEDEIENSNDNRILYNLKFESESYETDIENEVLNNSENYILIITNNESVKNEMVESRLLNNIDGVTEIHDETENSKNDGNEHKSGDKVVIKAAGNSKITLADGNNDKKNVKKRCIKTDTEIHDETENSKNDGNEHKSGDKVVIKAAGNSKILLPDGNNDKKNVKKRCRKTDPSKSKNVNETKRRRKTIPSKQTPDDSFVKESLKYYTLIDLSLQEQIDAWKTEVENIWWKTKDIHKCDICLKKFPKKKACEKHISHHNPRRGKFECAVCKERYASQIRLDGHTVRTHSKKYLCIKCPKILYNFEAARRHEFKHSEKVFQCEHCEYSSRARSTFWEHVRRVHNNRVHCARCGRTCTNRRGLATHLAMAHPGETDDVPEKLFRCEPCGFDFYSQGALNVHIVTALQHRNDKSTLDPAKKTTCGRCAIWFDTRAELANHVRVKHNSYTRTSRYRPPTAVPSHRRTVPQVAKPEPDYPKSCEHVMWRGNRVPRGTLAPRASITPRVARHLQPRHSFYLREVRKGISVADRAAHALAATRAAARGVRVRRALPRRRRAGEARRHAFRRAPVPLSPLPAPVQDPEQQVPPRHSETQEVHAVQLQSMRQEVHIL